MNGRSPPLFFAALLAVGCSGSDPAGLASARVGELTLTLTRRASHPVLAEYDRTVVVSVSDSVIATGGLMRDTGGNRRIDVYLTPTGRITLVSQFDDRYAIDPAAATPFAPVHDTMTGDLVGAFDENSTGAWRFAPAARVGPAIATP